MGQNGSREDMGQIGSPIPPMESPGLGLLLGILPLQQVASATQSLGMEQYGSLEVQEQIKWHIHPMESHGLSLHLGILCFQQERAAQ
jgi:hypothetical protein